MSNPLSHVGERIEAVEILGEEHDGSNRFAAAELLLQARQNGGVDINRFTVEVMTKDYYVSHEIKEVLDLLDEARGATGEVPATFETRPPYVLNDEELSEEIIRRKFLDRVIEADLANSLWIIDNSADFVQE